MKQAGQVRLYALPITIKAALAYCRRKHRRLPKLQGALFAVGVAREGEVKPCGVAIVARPARKSQDGFTCTIARVATDGTPNACSFLYAKCRRITQLLGYRRAFTFTEDDESGVSLFAAQIEEDGDVKASKTGWQSRPGRETENKPRKRWDLLKEKRA